MAEERSRQHELVIAEAEKRGYSIDTFEANEHRISVEGQSEIIKQGIPERWLKAEAEQICDDKQLSKELFSKLEIRAPKSYRFSSIEDLDETVFDGTSFVCKPLIGTNGEAIEFDLKSKDDISAYLERWSSTADSFLLEEYVEGDDLRIQVIDGKIAAACMRKPAYVTGDGTSTLSELVDLKREKVVSKNPANRLEIDDASKALIKESGYEMEDVVNSCQIIPLKRIANMGQGATAYDIGKDFHPEIHNWVEKISKELGTGYFALDLLSGDPMDLEKTFALELNARAEWLHHTFSEGKKHNLAAVTLDALFN